MDARQLKNLVREFNFRGKSHAVEPGGWALLCCQNGFAPRELGEPQPLGTRVWQWRTPHGTLVENHGALSLEIAEG